MIRHLASIAEIVTDIDAAVHLYSEAMGLAVERQGPEYAIVTLPGVLHFGLWSRRGAAESIFGDPDRAGEVPLGFSVAFEVDDVAAALERLGGDSEGGTAPLQEKRIEPWGQTTGRLLALGGGVLEVCETPWARSLERDLVAKGSDS